MYSDFYVSYISMIYFMNFNGNFINRNEKVNNLTGKHKNDAFLSKQKPLHAKNGIKWLLGQYYTILSYNMLVIHFFIL